ncbi:DUF397 domain-containing protein [Kitasatospora sp. NPDC094019]|uniref:DUF397 domain-containing protein n=1 Tax=Kitasatospora sp. NPDC094019 TaxID=3364091 RepID=UPI0037F36C6A
MHGTAWQKSTFSGSGNDCVEVRTIDGVVEMRESDVGEVIVRITRQKFAAFLQGVKVGEFDRHAGVCEAS